MPDDGKIRITLDEIEKVNLDPHVPSLPTPGPVYGSVGGTRQWGTVASGTPSYPGTVEKGSVFFQGWLYLSLAGMLGATAGWAICEPSFVDGGSRNQWGLGNLLMFPLMLTLLCVGLAMAESIVERSMQKALIRGGLALILGVVLGVGFYVVASFIYRTLELAIINQLGHTEANPESNPLHWLARAVAWMVFGVSGGLVYGIAGFSGRKCLYGVIGGIIGAGIGGFLFDPIALATHGGAVSRAIGIGIFGGTTGLSIGLVESALKDRWLYVSAGPLAGKQFILYKPVTTLGSQQSSDVYLFKDSSIMPCHATVDLRGGRATLLSNGPTLIDGHSVSNHSLKSGDVIQIGRYAFTYQEKGRNH